MARRPSTNSVSSSIASTSTLPQLANFKPLPLGASSLPGFKTPTSPWPPHSASLSAQPQQSATTNGIDPDELFTKYTVAEVKNVQLRLGADADAKQEELRLMVGERYRDLLQASTSIISIAQSSKRVLDALDDMRTSIPAAEEPHLLRRASMSGKDDSHLKTLQSLAAHLKLLLDTPEHLWRLIEKKKFLHAAWLFLLARVLHRVLVREDVEEGEENWKAHGIDEQFPLVQRQWDVVAQFRTQITHKATLSLREFSASVELYQDICSILLTLHLLESRPLTDTLTVFLFQRSKGLQASFSRTLKVPSNGQSSRLPNGSAHARPRKVVTREVRESIEAVLEIIAMTVGAARDIFRDEGFDRPSLMGRVLDFIQSESPTPNGSSLPPELQMSTQNLLGTLPSGSQHLVLPPSIRSYKPYIDLDSSSSSVSQAQLSDRLREWFHKAVHELQSAAEKWFLDLQTLREVWAIRTWVRNWINDSAHLEETEQTILKSAIDVLVGKQAAEIWRSALNDMEHAFRTKLDSASTALSECASESVIDASPAKHLFQAAPTPSLYEASLGSTSMLSSYQKYKSALQRQVAGRTPLLDGVLRVIENRAEALHKDLRAVRKDEGDSRKLTIQLNEAYRPDADRLCGAIVDILSFSMAKVEDESGRANASHSCRKQHLKLREETAVHIIVFFGRIANELSASDFLSNVSCGTDAGDEFQAKITALYELAVDRWRKYTVRSVVAKYRKTCLSLFTSGRARDSASLKQPGPSSSLMQALLSISASVRDLGPSKELSCGKSLAEATLKHFITSLLDGLHSQNVSIQLLWDLKFLRKLSELWGSEWREIAALLDHEITRLSQSEIIGDHLDDSLSEDILRTQLLLAPLLPPPLPPTDKPKNKDRKPSPLLQFGIPVVEQQVQPPMDLVKPGPRFGQLLVGSTAVR
ncbi:hypothetical protein EW146_g6653 [Bondarzewia mesenterica]|uniref:Conserved oligomeric Golgi complex subunit 1 n=1 Tax=Bondarzewia mesenterica TaxID=1095465 RepID=A0A4S4LNV9_9AGAM|nr:hypothetical protein EW146_g6653 [Bondarzewia mesenterica]